MNKDIAVHPWDDEAMSDDLMELVQRLPRVRLDELEAPSVPGAYVQFASADVPILGALADGRYPVYVGLALKSLRERIGRYRQSLRGMEALGEKNIFVLMVPCASAASAAYSERALIAALSPLFNGMGWGAKTPGAQRSGQRPSPIDSLFPGRSWAQRPSLTAAASAELGVVSYLARLDPDGPRWSTLASASAS